MLCALDFPAYANSIFSYTVFFFPSELWQKFKFDVNILNFYAPDPNKWSKIFLGFFLQIQICLQANTAMAKAKNVQVNQF